MSWRWLDKTGEESTTVTRPVVLLLRLFYILLFMYGSTEYCSDQTWHVQSIN